MNQYNVSDYLDAITREIQKRVTTYPKIIKKKKKQGIPKNEIFEEIMIQQRQIITLIQFEYLLNNPEITHISATLANTIMFEIKREMKMRKKCYPRMIYFKRITQEKAQEEKAIWESLIHYFDETYYSIYKNMPA